MESRAGSRCPDREFLSFTSSLRRIDKRLVNRGMAAIQQVMVVGTGHALNHGYEDDIVSGIHPKPGPGGAVPEESALAVRQVGFRRIEHYRAIEAVAEAGPHDVLANAEFSRKQACRQVVGGHQFNRCRSQYPLALELSAIGEHLRKVIVVLGS